MSTAHPMILPNMTTMRPLFGREASKRNKHEAYACAEGYDFSTWVVDPYGATTFTARNKGTKCFDGRHPQPQPHNINGKAVPRPYLSGSLSRHGRDQH